MPSRLGTLAAWADRQRPAVVVIALVVLWLAVGAALAVLFSGRIRDWSVMTDELLYTKLATSIAETLSPLPSVHGTSIEVYNQLYPLLLAPLYGWLAPPDAFRSAHVLNAFVMTSAAFPAYLLARQAVGRAWSFTVAALSIVVPWMILTGFVMTEVAAYPAFLWAILGLQLAIAEPSPRRDLLAAGALALAGLARTQFLVLALVLPLAVLAHEIGYRRSVGAGARAALSSHRLLALLYALGAVVAGIVALFDSAGGLLGVYAVTVEEGSLLPRSIWSAAARHVDAVAIGCGLAPLLLGGGWLLATVVRPGSKREHALATLSLATVVALTFEVASFVVRFGSDVIRDRYLFYVVPLLLVGTAAALSGAARRKHVAFGAAVVTVFFAATAASLPFTTYPGVWIDSPASVLNDLLVEQSGGLATGTFVALLGLLTGLVLVLGLLFASRTLLAGVVVGALGVFSVLTLASEADRILGATGLSGRPLAEPPGVVLDWVDSVLPDGEQAALVAFPVSTAWDTTAIRWWDVELWNRSVARAHVSRDGNFTYTPFPDETLEVDLETGEVPGTDDAPGYVVSAPFDSRFQLAGTPVAENVGFVVRAVERPYRALWATSGLDADGWARPGVPAEIRVYGGGPTQLDVDLRTPEDAPARYVIESAEERRVGVLEAGGERVERMVVCVPAGGHAAVTLTAASSARIPEVQLSPTVSGTRPVGALVTPLTARALPGGGC
jgi:hypothetical protein